MSEKKSLFAHLPVMRYSPSIIGIEENEVMRPDLSGQYVRVTDVEELIQKLAKPEVLNKAIKSLMFGGSFDLEKILLDTSK